MLSVTVKVPAVTDASSISPASLATVAVIGAVPGSTIESGSAVKPYVAFWVPLSVNSTVVPSPNVTVTVSPEVNT